jgi:hypothetical protein
MIYLLVHHVATIAVFFIVGIDLGFHKKAMNVDSLPLAIFGHHFLRILNGSEPMYAIIRA